MSENVLSINGLKNRRDWKTGDYCSIDGCQNLAIQSCWNCGGGLCLNNDNSHDHYDKNTKKYLCEVSLFCKFDGCYNLRMADSDYCRACIS